MKVIKLVTKDILKDFFFCFTSDSELSTLQRSILESGIRTPVHVRALENGFQLLSGFKRFKCALALGLDVLPAAVVPQRITLDRAFLHVLYEHMTCTRMNLGEKARVLTILDGLGVSLKLLKRDFLPLLNLPYHHDSVQRVKDILRFHPDVINYIEQYDLSLKQAGMFQELSTDQQGMFIHMAVDLKMRSVELAEIVRACQDISYREGISLEDIFLALDIQRIVESKEITRNEKIHQIRINVNKQHSPYICSLNEKLEMIAGEMDFPGEVGLTWDRSMERPGIQMKVGFESFQNVRQFARHLSNRENLARIKEMFRVL